MDAKEAIKKKRDSLMDVKEVIKKKRELRTKLTNIINKEISDFSDETGLSIDQISVSLTCFSEIGKEEKMIVTDVDIIIKI